MDPKLKKAWVKALRSGEYKQGRGHMCEDTPEGPRYCCLGVLVDIAHDGDWVLDPNITTWKIDNNFDPSFQASFPSNKFLNEVELNRDTADEVAHMNDDGKSFEEIADFIEESVD